MLLKLISIWILSFVLVHANIPPGVLSVVPVESSPTSNNEKAPSLETPTQNDEPKCPLFCSSVKNDTDVKIDPVTHKKIDIVEKLINIGKVHSGEDIGVKKKEYPTPESFLPIGQAMSGTYSNSTVRKYFLNKNSTSDIEKDLKLSDHSSTLNPDSEKINKNKKKDDVNKTSETAKNTTGKTMTASEVDDMNKNVTYNGECDLDDVKNVSKKIKCIQSSNSSDSKKTTESSSDAEILPGFNKSGPHLVPKESVDKKIVTSVNDKAEKIVVGSSIDKSKESSILTLRKVVTISVVSLTILAMFGYFGLIIWRRIVLKRNGGQILINEEEFCDECSDSHEFEMNQQRRNIIV